VVTTVPGDRGRRDLLDPWPIMYCARSGQVDPEFRRRGLATARPARSLAVVAAADARPTRLHTDGMIRPARDRSTNGSASMPYANRSATAVR